VSTSFVVTLTPDDYLAANRLLFWRERKRLKLSIVDAMIWSALAAWGIYMAWNSSQDVHSTAFWLRALSPVIFGLIALLLIYLAMYLSLPSQSREMFAENKAAAMPATYHVENEAIEIRDELGSSKLPYSMLHQWACNHNVLVISVVKGFFYIIPRRCLTSDALTDVVEKLRAADVPTNIKANKL
jgi:hypothetical protein